MMWPYVKYEEGINPWVTYAKKYIHVKNNSINLIMSGKTGSSKSWGLLSFLIKYDPDFEFEINENWFFHASPLMKTAKKKWPAGKILAYDEAGIDLHNLDYWNELNRGLNAFLQTGRHRNYFFALTTPYISQLSKGVRTLLNCHWRAMGWNKKNESIIIPRTLEYNDDMDKFYRKRLMVKKPTETIFCNAILLPKPPDKIIKEYEKVKTEFTDTIFDSTAARMERFEKQRKAKATKGYFTIEMEEVLGYLKEGLTVPKIAKQRKRSINTIYSIMRALTKRGVQIKPINKDKHIIRYDINEE